MKEINVVMIYDIRRLPYVGIALYSMLKNLNKDDYKINCYFVTTSVAEKDLEDIKKLQDKYSDNFELVKHVDFDEFLNTSETVRLLTDNPLTYHPNVCMAKLYLHLIFPELDKVIYIDDDTITLTSISNLWNQELEASILGTECTEFDNSNKKYYEGNISSYINSGCIVLNLKRMRETNFFDKVIALHGQYGLISDADEIFLNLAVGEEDRQTFLDNRFNFITALVETGQFFTTESQRHDAFMQETVKGYTLCNEDEIEIIHFANCRPKPWDTSNFNRFRNFKDIWHTYNTEYNKLLGKGFPFIFNQSKPDQVTIVTAKPKTKKKKS